LEAGVRIVLADDNEEIRSALGLLLRESGALREDSQAALHCTIAEADNALAVIRHLEAGPCDVVLFDWQLPGLPSGELLAKIRELSPRCTVVAMSGSPEARRQSSSLGVDAFVSKHEPPDKLLELLQLTQTVPDEEP
jgi:DNA-binding NarL/FixJ family response regulator